MSSAGDDILRLRRWTLELLLPFFVEEGLSSCGAFVEEFDLGGRPMPNETFHTRVQARQIYAFAHCALLAGERRYAEIAFAGFEWMVSHLWNRSAGGWVHAATLGGEVVDERCDAYDQAFPLLALAYLRRLGMADADRWIEGALEALDRRLKDTRHGGYYEIAPIDAAGRFRRQNPHMHLLEAFLALEQAGWAGDALGRATDIVGLFSALAERDGAIGEYFLMDWSPPPQERDVRQPGHQFEWAWLLDVHGGRSVLAHRLASFGWHYGIERDPSYPYALFEEVTPDGGVKVASKLLWPQTEAIRYCARRARMGDEEAATRANRLAGIVLAWFAMSGRPLWYNQIDRSGKPLVRNVPSRVLYHIVTCTADTAMA